MAETITQTNPAIGNVPAQTWTYTIPAIELINKKL